MNESPNDSERTKQMRSDMARIKKMIMFCEDNKMSNFDRLRHENNIFRELLTSWQAITQMDYSTDERLQLNMLTKRVVDRD